MERLALALGIEVNADDPNAEHPSKEDADAYNQASFASWLDAQVRTSDDFIAPPPPRLKDFLERRQSALWHLAGRLEGETPDWGYDIKDDKRAFSRLGLAQRLNRVILAAALVEERGGHQVEAGRLLGASWSLSSSVSELPDMLSQFVAIALGKLQLGVLRKLSDPSGEWLERLSSDRPWQKFIDSYEYEPLIMKAQGKSVSEGEKYDAYVRGWRRIADNLRERSPCHASKMSEQQFWQPMEDEYRRLQSEDPSEAVESLRGVATPNLMSGLRRAARLAVDRELTAKILEIRQEKAALRPSRWPEKFSDTESRICPGESYGYQVRGAAMAFRFKSSIADPGEPALVLPLSFEVRAPRPPPTPTRTPRPTPTPATRP